jgi:hypothetical protein
MITTAKTVPTILLSPTPTKKVQTCWSANQAATLHHGIVAREPIQSIGSEIVHMALNQLISCLIIQSLTVR